MKIDWKSEKANSLNCARREFFCGGAALLAVQCLNWNGRATANKPKQPVIDTHIHLFDPTRPQGVPYRGPENAATYATGASAAGYSAIAAPFGVVGAIAVEASPWVEDNLWLLDAAQMHEIIVGVVGNLDLNAKDFPEVLNRFAKNSLFLGVRSGNLWGRDLAAQIAEPHVRTSLAAIAGAQRVFETANPNIKLLQAVARIADDLPDLTIVIDHFPRFYPAHSERGEYAAVVRTLADRPGTFVKLSGGPLPFPDSSSHAPPIEERLEQILETWPADSLLFGSDWPNVEKAVPAAASFRMIDTLAAKQALTDLAGLCWRNSQTAYRWLPRSTCQKQLLAGIGADLL